LIVLCWMAAGFVIFDFPQSQKHSDTTMPSHVSRIVSMAPNLTEILFALGLDDEIAGVTLCSDYPPAATEKTKVGTFWQPNIEAVIAAKPDLVITLGFDLQQNLAERLNRIGYNTLTVNIEKVSQLFEAIGIIAAATDRQDRADELTRGIRKKLNRLAAVVANSEKVRVLWVVQEEPLRVAGRDTFINEMIELAGGENAIGPTIHKYPPIGAEQVIACSPHVIIEPAMEQQDIDGQQHTAMQYWSKFNSLPAVKNRHIYVIDADRVSRLGPRLYEGVETIARCLRPQLFAN